MKIWKYKPDGDHYYTLALTDYKRDSQLFHADNFKSGKLFSEPLPQIAVHYETASKDLSPLQRSLLRSGKLPRGDFPVLFGTEVIFRERALQALRPLIKDSIQVIPLQCKEDKLYLIHVTNFVDCLDRTRSKIKWLTGFENKIIFQVHHYEFFEKNIVQENIFRIPELFTTTFVSDTFKTTVEGQGLQGLLWEPLP